MHMKKEDNTEWKGLTTFTWVLYIGLLRTWLEMKDQGEVDLFRLEGRREPWCVNAVQIVVNGLRLAEL